MEPAQALILGATPAIAEMQWPKKWFITGIEKSKEVIKAIWPGDIAGHRKAISCDWFEIPETYKGCSAIVGDGSFIVCQYPNALQKLVRSLHGLLREDGLLVIRCYCQLDTPESVDQVFASLLRGEISSIDNFKLR